jgi:D-threo-aldose 1-dehydrogenase
LGATDLAVTALCIGCAEHGNMVDTFGYEVSEAQSQAFFEAAFAGPINFFDTAAIYGYGESERRLGLALRAHGGLPAGMVVATKADRDPATNRFDGDQAHRSIEASLRRLGLAHLQLVYLHDPEYCRWEEVMAPVGACAVLQGYVEQGVIGRLGLAGGPIDVLLRYLATGYFSAVITHNRYSLLNRVAEPLLAAAASQGVALLNAAPYGSGLLAKGPSVYPRYAYRAAPPAVVAAATRMEAACQAAGVPLAAAALQFSLRQPRIAATIVGMSRPERLAATIALARQPIPDSLWPELERLVPPMGDPQAG